MIVDDDRDVLQSTELLLSVMGYDPVPLADARKIIEVAARERPDVILQDLRMPNFDLAVTVDGLRRNATTQGIPIVFFSADPDASSKAAEHNVSGVLTKPFQHRELDAILHRVFGDEYIAGRIQEPGQPPPQIGNAFHDFWNEMAAVNNYLAVLQQRLQKYEGGKIVVRELEARMLRLAHLVDDIQRQATATQRPHAPTAGPLPK